jgi:hypothetical protein
MQVEPDVVPAGITPPTGDKYFFTFILTLFPYDYSLSASRLVTEGCLRKHLQTRGGERWPGHDLASEMRCEGPAVQAANLQRDDVAPGGSDGRGCGGSSEAEAPQVPAPAR